MQTATKIDILNASQFKKDRAISMCHSSGSIAIDLVKVLRTLPSKANRASSAIENMLEIPDPIAK